MNDLKELTAFALVLRTGSLTAAARELDLPKSTISRRIQHLELSLDQSLLRREGNRVEPTEAGTLLARYAQQILSIADRGQEALEAIRQEVSGELLLYIHTAFIRGWLMPIVEDFMARHEGIRVMLRTCNTFPEPDNRDAICLWLGAPPASSTMRAEQVGSLARGIYAHPEYLHRWGSPTHPRELHQHHWIDLIGDSETEVTLSHAEQGSFAAPTPPSRLRVSELVLHTDAISRGRGLGILPHWLVGLRERAHPGELAASLPGWEATPQPVHLLYPHGQLPRRSIAFLDALRAAVPDAWHTHRQPQGAHTVEGRAAAN